MATLMNKMRAYKPSVVKVDYRVQAEALIVGLFAKGIRPNVTVSLDGDIEVRLNGKNIVFHTWFMVFTHLNTVVTSDVK